MDINRRISYEKLAGLVRRAEDDNQCKIATEWVYANDVITDAQRIDLYSMINCRLLLLRHYAK